MPSLLKKLIAQVNPFDNGATFKNPTPVQTKPLPARAPSTTSAISTPTNNIGSNLSAS